MLTYFVCRVCALALKDDGDGKVSVVCPRCHSASWLLLSDSTIGMMTHAQERCMVALYTRQMVILKRNARRHRYGVVRTYA